MSTIEYIEDEIRKLAPEELAELRDWFLEFDAQRWDEEIEQDVKSGRLDRIAEGSLQAWRNGKATKL